MNLASAQVSHYLLDHNPIGNSEMELILLKNLKECVKKGGEIKKLATDLPHQIASQCASKLKAAHSGSQLASEEKSKSSSTSLL